MTLDAKSDSRVPTFTLVVPRWLYPNPSSSPTVTESLVPKTLVCLKGSEADYNPVVWDLIDQTLRDLSFAEAKIVRYVPEFKDTVEIQFQALKPRDLLLVEIGIGELSDKPLYVYIIPRQAARILRVSRAYRHGAEVKDRTVVVAEDPDSLSREVLTQIDAQLAARSLPPRDEIVIIKDVEPLQDAKWLNAQVSRPGVTTLLQVVVDPEVKTLQFSSLEPYLYQPVSDLLGLLSRSIARYQVRIPPLNRARLYRAAPEDLAGAPRTLILINQNNARLLTPEVLTAIDAKLTLDSGLPGRGPIYTTPNRVSLDNPGLLQSLASVPNLGAILLVYASLEYTRVSSIQEYKTSVPIPIYGITIPKALWASRSISDPGNRDFTLFVVPQAIAESYPVSILQDADAAIAESAEPRIPSRADSVYILPQGQDLADLIWDLEFQNPPTILEFGSSSGPEEVLTTESNQIEDSEVYQFLVPESKRLSASSTEPSIAASLDQLHITLGLPPADRWTVIFIAQNLMPPTVDLLQIIDAKLAEAKLPPREEIEIIPRGAEIQKLILDLLHNSQLLPTVVVVREAAVTQIEMTSELKTYPEIEFLIPTYDLKLPSDNKRVLLRFKDRLLAASSLDQKFQAFRILAEGMAGVDAVYQFSNTDLNRLDFAADIPTLVLAPETDD